MTLAREQLRATVRAAFAEAAEKVVAALEAESGPPSERPSPGDGDRLLTADEVAACFRRSVGWVYRNARHWPFTRREGRKTVRFSEAGLNRYLARDRP
jgi:hypothetical protein